MRVTRDRVAGRGPRRSPHRSPGRRACRGSPMPPHAGVAPGQRAPRAWSHQRRAEPPPGRPHRRGPRRGHARGGTRLLPDRQLHSRGPRHRLRRLGGLRRATSCRSAAPVSRGCRSLSTPSATAAPTRPRTAPRSTGSACRQAAARPPTVPLTEPRGNRQRAHQLSPASNDAGRSPCPAGLPGSPRRVDGQVLPVTPNREPCHPADPVSASDIDGAMPSSPPALPIPHL